MAVIHAVVGIVHDRDHFLLLKKQGKWVGWQFPQGAHEAGETQEEAVLREIKEETGLDAAVEQVLPFKRDYWFTESGERIHKYLTYFLVKADMTQDIHLSREHSAFAWCTREQVLQRLMYNKDVFAEAI
ncbi:NUDIX domain-containing protein [Candidatus Woesearchaeota archaeon]|nr:NUDIX domain-containing protein [Candidatus Woesearchaeota archaeon]